MKRVYMRYPNFRSKALTLSYDDGVEQDARFIDIINKAGIKCTFNLSSNKFLKAPKEFAKGKVHRLLTRDAAIALYKDSGHEVAVHTLDHLFPIAISPIVATAQVYEDRKKLEQMFDTEVRGMAYPYGQYPDTMVEIVKNCGIAYARTTDATHSFSLPTDWLRLPTTCHHKDPKLTALCDQFLNKNIKERAILFYLWGHTFEFESDNNWDVIEEFCDKMGGHDDIWYATNIEICDYVEAYRTLRFSADGAYVTNPTCIPIYLYVQDDDKYHIIQPGERIKL